MWKCNPCNKLQQRYDKEVKIECELCGKEDSPFHFVSCETLQESQQVKKLFGNLKAEISKQKISATFWDIILQSLRGEAVNLPDGTPTT